MRVLFMADMMPDPNQGASGTEVQTIGALRRLGCKVDEIWSTDLPHKIKHGNLHYLLELPISYRNEMLKKLSLHRYDVIHVNQPHGYLAAITVNKRYQDTIFIHRSHGIELRAIQELRQWKKLYDKKKRHPMRRAASKILERLLKRSSSQIARYADGHIVYASECQEFLVDKLGVSKNRIAIIPQSPPDNYKDDINPINVGRFKRILYVGQFAFFKAPMILAKVISELANNRENISITWVCSKKDHEEARILLEPSVRPRVQFLDWMTQGELRNIYDTHGIFLFPSFFEGFGKVFLEAMSRGLCVVAADNGGMKDIIQNNVSGIRVPTGDISAMTTACLDLIDQPNKAIAISEKAIEKSRQFTSESLGHEILDFYKSILQLKLTDKKIIY